MSPDFMKRAISLALDNVRSGSGGPFAALIVKEDRIIAEGTNRVTLTNDPTAHAEVVAIRGACRVLADFQLSGCDLYTTCEPCPMCLGAIYWARPARIFYAATAADSDDAASPRRFPRDIFRLEATGKQDSLLMRIPAFPASLAIHECLRFRPGAQRAP